MVSTNKNDCKYVKPVHMVRFHETRNVSYQMVYDSKTEEEHTEVYDLLPILNEQNREIYLLNEKINHQGTEIVADNSIMEYEAMKQLSGVPCTTGITKEYTRGNFSLFVTIFEDGRGYAEIFRCTPQQEKQVCTKHELNEVVKAFLSMNL